MKKVRLLFIFIGLIVAIACGSKQDSETAAAGNATDAVSFVLQTLDGNKVDSKQLRGNVLVVDFWATWCQPCIKEIPEYNAFHKKYSDSTVEMVAITLESGDAETVKPFVEKHNIDYPVYMGNNEVRAEFGGIQVFPTTFIVDQKGKIQEKFLGAGPNKIKKIETAVKELLEKAS
ncbi:TlpA family protein disulfide reductase [candidate division KSB1 bacterium]|nr:TlpA family protein disulfide reductase [candidate division KSB1 bacterium]NIR73326.1 TlpA family protein disulfide reductase [candidate division KSB1 bacterium]NIS27032.1 TlpA family protein disulfide reductase [candidate division KSB1 bacterium]NIT73872.1 TlpA family protein disulfide reductase [candidate division KSB1 bacterium]NIU27777.1 TlpA family protein disulfide reductase [candidate division KSB1 bacterium]